MIVCINVSGLLISIQRYLILGSLFPCLLGLFSVAEGCIIEHRMMIILYFVAIKTYYMVIDLMYVIEYRVWI